MNQMSNNSLMKKINEVGYNVNNPPSPGNTFSKSNSNRILREPVNSRTVNNGGRNSNNQRILDIHKNLEKSRTAWIN